MRISFPAALGRPPQEDQEGSSRRSSIVMNFEPSTLPAARTPVIGLLSSLQLTEQASTASVSPLAQLYSQGSVDSAAFSAADFGGTSLEQAGSYFRDSAAQRAGSDAQQRLPYEQLPFSSATASEFSVDSPGTISQDGGSATAAAAAAAAAAAGPTGILPIYHHAPAPPAVRETPSPTRGVVPEGEVIVQASPFYSPFESPPRLGAWSRRHAEPHARMDLPPAGDGTCGPEGRGAIGDSQQAQVQAQALARTPAVGEVEAAAAEAVRVRAAGGAAAARVKGAEVQAGGYGGGSGVSRGPVTNGDAHEEGGDGQGGYASSFATADSHTPEGPRSEPSVDDLPHPTPHHLPVGGREAGGRPSFEHQQQQPPGVSTLEDIAAAILPSGKDFTASQTPKPTLESLAAVPLPTSWEGEMTATPRGSSQPLPVTIPMAATAAGGPESPPAQLSLATAAPAAAAASAQRARHPQGAAAASSDGTGSASVVHTASSGSGSDVFVEAENSGATVGEGDGDREGGGGVTLQPRPGAPHGRVEALVHLSPERDEPHTLSLTGL
jgi:hypothetical protein